jgi:hypothetical protein
MYFEIFSLKSEPPDVALEEDANEVDDPEECGTCNEENDREDNTENVTVADALDEAIYLPDDCDGGEGEDNLHDKRKIVESLNDIFHCINSFK